MLHWGAWPGVGERLTAARQKSDIGFIGNDLLQNALTFAAICKARYRPVPVRDS